MNYLSLKCNILSFVLFMRNEYHLHNKKHYCPRPLSFHFMLSFNAFFFKRFYRVVVVAETKVTVER